MIAGEPPSNQAMEDLGKLLKVRMELKGGEGDEGDGEGGGGEHGEGEGGQGEGGEEGEGGEG